MKHLNTLKVAALGIFASLLMNSCSTNNEFAKQKYTNFKHSKHHTNPVKSNYPSSEAIVNKDVVKKEAIALPAADNTATVATSQENTPAIQKNESNYTAVTDKANSTPAKPKQNIAISNKKAITHTGKFATLRAFKATASALKKSESPAASGDVDLVILVILAIFIPPLAVYLKEGATTRFVIDLILALIGIFAWWIFPFAGLAYLAAIIYALIIVLGKA